MCTAEMYTAEMCTSEIGTVEKLQLKNVGSTVEICNGKGKAVPLLAWSDPGFQIS
jgi:hypothetical protein